MWRAPTARAPSVLPWPTACVVPGTGWGVFSSPWVTDFREQITVDGRMIPKQDFADCVEVFAKEPLTEFELITAVMYLYFYRSGVDYAVVECGMGGAGDCTNVLAHPTVCAFAKVALDHTAFLGDTVEAIAREKSGIIKPGCPVVLYPHIAAKDVFLEQCRALHCPVTEAAQQGDPIADDLAVAGEVLRLLGVDTTQGCLCALPGGSTLAKICYWTAPTIRTVLRRCCSICLRIVPLLPYWR